MFYKRFLLFFIGLMSGLFFSTSFASNNLSTPFPLDKYSQSVMDWIKPSDLDYDSSLLSSDMQKKRMDEFYNHLFGVGSPWDATYVGRVISQSAPDDLITVENSIISKFNNQDPKKPANEIGYDSHSNRYPDSWLNAISNNLNINQFQGLVYQSANRGIAVTNLAARVLPTEDGYFYSDQLAGEGYPFDYLQMSALWAGTPIYILGETRDHVWSYVITPDYIAWVKSSGIARVDDVFVNAYASKNIAAITHTETQLTDEKGQVLFSAYVGSVFPVQASATDIKIKVPAANLNHIAEIKYVTVSSDDAVVMPFSATPHHFASVMNTLIGRPYGWGSLEFNNDCSAELKSLYTPFGIWLPRHSSYQVNVGKMVDMSSSTPEQRLSYLMQNGRRFLTIIYLGGHVVTYIGNYSNPNSNDHALMAMTYQNIWGLRPIPPAPDRRAVIGKSVLFPLLLQYPEDVGLLSLVAKSYFQVSYLDEMPSNQSNQAVFYQINSKKIDLRALMSPEMPDNKL